MTPEDYEVAVLSSFDDKIKDVSEMTLSERQFLNGVLRQYKPKKIVELGVAAGSSAAVTLNAIKDDPDARLISIDYAEQYYKDPRKKSGFIVDERTPELKHKWTLYAGGLASNFMDEIGDGIDMCILDTMHAHPGEFLDFLMVLPYLKKNAIVLIHDISLHVHMPGVAGNTCGILMSALKGQKLIPQRTEYGFSPNIGAAILADDIKDNVWDFFHLLTLKWQYRMKPEELTALAQFFARHYDHKYIDLFNRIVSFQTSIPIRPKTEKKYRLTVLRVLKAYLLFPIYIFRIHQTLTK